MTVPIEELSKRIGESNISFDPEKPGSFEAAENIHPKGLGEAAVTTEVDTTQDDQIEARPEA